MTRFDKSKVTGIIKTRHLYDDIGDVQHQGASPLWLFIIFKHTILKNSNCLRLKNGLYKSCRSQPDLQLCSWKFFDSDCFGTQIRGLNFEFQVFKIFRWPEMEKIYIKVVGRDQIYNFVVQKIFIWECYSCEIGYIRHLWW